MDRLTHLNEASLATIDIEALGPDPDLDSWFCEWQDWLDLRVNSGEISAAIKAAYTRGAEQYFSFAKDWDPADLDTLRAWQESLRKQYETETIHKFLAGVKCFVHWWAETQRFL